MGGNQSTPQSPEIQTLNDQEYFGVKLTQSLMDDLGGGVSVVGSSSSPPKSFNLLEWRAHNSARQTRLDNTINQLNRKATALFGETSTQVSTMERKLFSSISKNNDVPCKDIQKELAFALQQGGSGDLEYVKVTNLELKECLKNAMVSSKK